MSLLFSTLYRSLDEWLQFLGIVGGRENGAVSIDKHDFARATLVGMLLPYTVAVLIVHETGPRVLVVFHGTTERVHVPFAGNGYDGESGIAVFLIDGNECLGMGTTWAAPRAPHVDDSHPSAIE